MLLEEFDACKTAVINPEMFKKEEVACPKTCVSFFSKSIMKEFLKIYKPEILFTIDNATAVYPIYKINYKGEDLCVMQASVGASVCVGNFEDASVHGIKNILLVGSCGCLKEGLEDYSIIIPTSALRDEGTSYHYAKPSDEIKLDKKVVSCIENKIKELGLHYHKGKVWTTDGIYRETRAKLERRKAQGAIAVDMECSAMTAFCKFRKINFAQIFYGADSLAKEEYQIRSLVDGDINEKAKIIPVAFECALEMNKLTNSTKEI